MSYGEHRVPDPLQDEDKWLHLTKRQMLIIIFPLLLAAGIIKVTIAIGILPFGIFLTVVLLILTGAFLLIDVPPEKYLFGSGNKLEKIAFRLLMKKLPMNKKIYTKNLDNGIERWKDK
ncbi:MAG: hypothetical protein J6B90_02790 [Lachnospiraceae bacterium]|nr:hypothetical protein [Lachnospiraceae bacterium]